MYPVPCDRQVWLPRPPAVALYTRTCIKRRCSKKKKKKGREGACDRGGREGGRKEGGREHVTGEGGRGGEGGREGGEEGGGREGEREGERKEERGPGGEEKRKDGVRRELYT